jgi:AcrR family transcriptional regulator
MVAVAVPRRSQAERRATSRAALLEAALDTLTVDGSAGFTTAEVCRRAGLSQGSLFKHFGSRSELLAATTEHLFGLLRADYTASFLDPSFQPRTIRHALDLLWTAMTDERLAAAFDLYTDARTDSSLRASIEPVVRSHLDHIAQLAGELLGELDVESTETTQATIELAILSMQGLVLNEMAAPDPAARRRLDAILDQLAHLLLAGSAT